MMEDNQLNASKSKTLLKPMCTGIMLVAPCAIFRPLLVLSDL